MPPLFPPAATLQPGDTLPLKTQAGPAFVSSYVWSTAQDLTVPFAAARCLLQNTKCIHHQKLSPPASTVAFDSAFSVIDIPPADDFTIAISTIDCAGKDSVHASFTLCNNFKRGTIPAGLQVTFYDADPQYSRGSPAGPGIYYRQFRPGSMRLLCTLL